MLLRAFAGVKGLSLIKHDGLNLRSAMDFDFSRLHLERDISVKIRGCQVKR